MWIFWNFPGAREQAQLATEALDRAIALAPDAVETRLAQGYFYFYGRGDSEEALRHFTAAEALKPSDANVITAIGLILRGQGRWEEAVAAFERARTYDYRSYNLIYTLGETYLRMRRWEEAERYLQLAASLAPEVGTAYRDLLRIQLGFNRRHGGGPRVHGGAAGGEAGHDPIAPRVGVGLLPRGSAGSHG